MELAEVVLDRRAGENDAARGTQVLEHLRRLVVRRLQTMACRTVRVENYDDKAWTDPHQQ
jgi:hypothetical protein